MTQKQKEEIRPMVELNGMGEMTFESAKRIAQKSVDEIRTNELNINYRAVRISQKIRLDLEDDKAKLKPEIVDKRLESKRWIKKRHEISKIAKIYEYSDACNLITKILLDLEDGIKIETYEDLEPYIVNSQKKRPVMLSNAIKTLREHNLADLPCMRMKSCVLKKGRRGIKDENFIAFIQSLRKKDIDAIYALKNKNGGNSEKYVMRDIVMWLSEPEQVKRFGFKNLDALEAFCKAKGFPSISKYRIAALLKFL